MPLEGDKDFKKLKKSYSKGIELRGKTIGIIGFGRIGQEVAKIALGIGMKIIVSDKFIKNSEIMIKFYDQQELVFKIQTDPLDYLLKNSDFITLHVPAQKNYVIGKKEFSMIKNGSAIINASRGGVIDELALLDSLNSVSYTHLTLPTNREV
mgnify:CR=1 FL=1